MKEKELDLRKRELELAADRQVQAAEQQQTIMKAFMSQSTATTEFASNVCGTAATAKQNLDGFNRK